MRLRPLLSLAIPFALAGCDILNPDVPNYHKEALDEVNSREALWKSQAIHHYDFDYQRSCFCGPSVTQMVTIEVRDDVIQRVLDAQGTEVPPEQGVAWPTVDSLFVWAKALLAHRETTVAVEFDPTTNYPTYIGGDDPRISDDEIVHRSSDLMVLLTASGVASYRIVAPFSKSNSVTWRSR